MNVVFVVNKDFSLQMFKAVFLKVNYKDNKIELFFLFQTLYASVINGLWELADQ